MNTQTKINEFVSKVPADELAAFFEECHIFGDSRLYRWDPVFRTYERRDFQMAKACLNCNPEKVTYYTTKLYCNYCAANYPEFTIGGE